MATPAVNNSIFQEIQGFYHDRRADVQQLGKALQSGNLTAAKQAFSDLVALGKSGPFSNADPFSKASREQAFEAIGQALQSGDLAGAQAAFSSFTGTLGNRGLGGGPQPVSPAVIVNISATQNTSNAGNVSDTESIYQQLQDFRDSRKSDISQLGTALHSGDTKSAQQAYDALVALGQSGPFADGKPFARADRAQAFSAIGTALKSGDLVGAQKAFGDLAATFENHIPTPKEPPIYPNPTPTTTPKEPPIYPNPTPTAGPVPEVLISIGGGTKSSSPEEIQINFGNNSSGGQLKIDVSQLQGTKAGEQITIDFNQPDGGKNEFIVNLFSSGATDGGASHPGASSNTSRSPVNLQA